MNMFERARPTVNQVADFLKLQGLLPVQPESVGNYESSQLRRASVGVGDKALDCGVWQIARGPGVEFQMDAARELGWKVTLEPIAPKPPPAA